MFFVLSKTLNYLVMPVFLVSTVLLASWIIKNARWKKVLFRIGVGLLLLFSNEFIANEVALVWEIPAVKMKDVGQYEWAILLTGVTKSNIDPADRVYFQRGADRVIHTVYLHKAGSIKKILVSGGDGNLLEARRKEAEEIREALVLMGVPESDIVIESNSRNTYESAVEVKRIVEEEKMQGPFLLVTSAFHMRRSLGCFRKVGLTVVPFSTDFMTHKRKFTPDSLIIPRVEGILIWNTLVKEWVGSLAYRLTGKI